MDVLLYNSAVCRLCGEENESGTLLYSCDENGQNLGDIINKYLPLKVTDDGQLPRTLCPGCTIQLEATVEFFNLIISGQKIIRELHQREKEYKKSLLLKSAEQAEIITEKIVYEINTSDGIYQVEHPISLQVAGLEKPRRKRGRPPKKPKSPEELAQEIKEKEEQLAREAAQKENFLNGEAVGKRRRKTPTRFREAVQGKELERIFKEEGMIDPEESESEEKAEAAAPVSATPEVIGHLEASGELVVVTKGKGRGRPRGRMRPTREQCSICGMEFSCVGRYMSHLAAHGRVSYRCPTCDARFDTRLDFTSHQTATGHQGQDILHQKLGTKTEGKEDTTQELPTLPDTQEASSDNIVEIDSKAAENTDQNGLDTSKSDIIKVEIEQLDEAVVEVTSSPVSKPEENTETEPAATVSEPVTGKLKLKCNICDKLFSNRQSKSMHMKVLNHPSSVVYHKEAAHAGRQYVCLKCGKGFKHRQLLQRHQLVHSQIRPHTCKVCAATFKTKANLVNHQLLHSGVKKFCCEICKQRFAHKTSLTLHMRLHSGLKPYTCAVCGKAFSQKGNLSEHERIHTGEKPYSCGVCARTFTTSSQHRLHAKRHLAERPYGCTQCGKRFVSAAVFRAHKRREESARRRDECGLQIRHNKQVSLLVDKQKQPRLKTELEPEVMAVKPEVALPPETEDGVIYVTYDVDVDERDAPTYHILDSEETELVEDERAGGCSLYSGDSLLLAEDSETATYFDEGDAHMAVTDEEGNPLHFTMQDGTRLAITSADGKSLQVITQDGQTIPVEINGYNEEEDEEQSDTIVHQLDLQKTVDADGTTPVAHYFTIV